MTWLNPAAFFGLVALAIPILVHLFGRRVAKRQRFPSLRLLLDARATPATRSRPSDLLLLILRCAIVLAAVMGLAQPRWLENRTRDAALPARLILVDTSASMRRLTSDGSSALDRARMLAHQVLDSAHEGIIVETANPGANVVGAVSWLVRRSGLRELMIASDFQVGTLSDGHLASLPDGIGLSLRRIAVAPTAGAMALDSAGVGIDAQLTMTRASWRSIRADSALPVTLLTAPSDSLVARSMLDAARALVPGAVASSYRATIAFPGSAPMSAPTASFTSAWQGNLLLALRSNQLLSDAAHAARLAPKCDAPGAVVARNSAGEVVASIVASDSAVLIHSCAETGSLTGTALVAAAVMALTSTPLFHEREPNIVPDDVLRRWERSPSAFAPRGSDEPAPDGRWFWLAAIALLVIEQLVRRGALTRSTSMEGGAGRERAA